MLDFYGPIKTALAVVLLNVAGFSRASAAEPKLVRKFDGTTPLVAIAPDGRTIAIGRSNAEEVAERAARSPKDELYHGKVLLIDLASGKEVFSIKSAKGKERGFRGSPVRGSFSPDGRWLAIVGSGASVHEAFQRGDVAIYDAQSGRLVRHLECGDVQVRCIAFSPDSKTLFTSSNRRRRRAGVWERIEVALLWDVSSGKLSQEFTLSVDAEDAAFSPDGKLLALGYYPGTHVVTVHDLDSGEVIFGPKREDDELSRSFATAFSPDGRFLAASLWLRDGEHGRTLRVWETSPWKEIAVPVEADEGVYDVAFSRDSRLMLTFGLSGRLTVRETASWKVLASKVVEPAPTEPRIVGDLRFPGLVWGSFCNHGEQVVVQRSDAAGKKNVWDLSGFLRSVAR